MKLRSLYPELIAAAVIVFASALSLASLLFFSVPRP
jgi:hypothetical protein